MKIIFADVDGCINNDDTVEKSPHGFVGVDEELIDRLRVIVESTGAKVVLSSDWRLEEDEDYHYLQFKLIKHGIEIYDHTPNLIKRIRRGDEIRKWLSQHDVESFAIIDDEWFPDFSYSDFDGHVVITDGRLGLQEEDVRKAIQILGVDKQIKKE